MFDDLSDLYQELILDHNAHPHHFGELTGANRQAHGHNPLCGDEVEVLLKIEGNIIGDIRFKGHGCAISKSSASIMTDVVKSKTLDEARKLFTQFHEMLTKEDAKVDKQALDKASVFEGVKQFPARVKCATLGWHTLLAAIDDKNEPVTTE